MSSSCESPRGSVEQHNSGSPMISPDLPTAPNRRVRSLLSDVSSQSNSHDHSHGEMSSDHCSYLPHPSIVATGDSTRALVIQPDSERFGDHYIPVSSLPNSSALHGFDSDDDFNVGSAAQSSEAPPNNSEPSVMLATPSGIGYSQLASSPIVDRGAARRRQLVASR